MDKIQNIIYAFLIMVCITIIILLFASYNIKSTEQHNSTETVSIEINKIENTSI